MPDIDIDDADRAMMARCIELSKIGAAAGELPFGSLVAHRGRMIAEATNETMRHVDESRHAEILAIARARQLLGDEELRNCTLYSTAEPCTMCSFCIRAAGIGRVVFALGSPKLGGCLDGISSVIINSYSSAPHRNWCPAFCPTMLTGSGRN